MWKNQVDDRYLLPFEGIGSGLLSCLFLRFGFLFGGFILGAVISLHLWLFRGVRSQFRLLGFTLTCTAAFVLAFFATGFSPFRPGIINLSGDSSGAIDSSPFLVGGFLGAATVCAGIYFFLASSKRRSVFLLKATCISAASGFLGVLGWAVGERLADAKLLSGAGSGLGLYTLLLIWQTGTTPLLGILLPLQEASVAAPIEMGPSSVALQAKKRGPAVSAGAVIFLVLVVSVIAWFIARQVQGERLARRRLAAEQAAERRLAAERPTSQYLPEIVELPIEQVLFLKPIAGHPCGHSGKRRELNFIGYTAGYKRSETASDDEVPLVDVNVRLYPNSDWAVYATKQGFDPSLEADNPSAVTTVTKFGNKVIMNTVMRDPKGGGDLFFYWASRNRFVFVRFADIEQDEFLRQYLLLYPSDL